MNINGETRILGIFGWPVKHSLSPLMHNNVIKEKGLNLVYLPFEVRRKDLGDAVQAIRALNLIGVNVTIPHKEAVIPYLDEVSQEVIYSGSVNTIVNKGGKLKGFNTDGEGYINSLIKAGFDVRNKRILILGAGGASRGIIASLIKRVPSGIMIANRTPSRAEEVAGSLSAVFSKEIEVIPFDTDSLQEKMKDIDLLVNTTPVGMEGKGELTIPLNSLPPHAVVSDIVYRPLKTGLLRDAEALGYHTIGGIGMLVEQGALSFKLWTGLDASRESMEGAILKALGQV